MDSHSIVFWLHDEVHCLIIFFRNKPWFCSFVFRIVSSSDSACNVDDALLVKCDYSLWTFHGPLASEPFWETLWSKTNRLQWPHALSASMDPKIRHIAFQGGLDEGQGRDRVWRGSRGSCPRTSCWTRPFCWPTGKGYREVGAPPHLLWDNTGTTTEKQTKRTGNYIDEEWLENLIILLREWPKTTKWDSTLS